MPDTEVAQPQVAEAASQQPAIDTELAANMAASLNAFLPPNKHLAVPQQSVEQPAPPDVPRGTQPENQPQQPVAQPAAQPEPVPFQFSTFTEKYGYKTPEEAFKEIEELRQFRNSPGVPASFKDEESASIYKALSEGKYDDVRVHLERQHRINTLIGLEVNKDTATDIVKYGMQLKYKDLTPQEIDYKFNKQFAVPPKPVIQAGEDQADYDYRVNEWQQIAADKQMELMIEAKMIRPEFETAKKQFTFPKTIDTPDEGYAQYQKMLADEDRIQEETMKAYQALQPAQLAVKLPFIDEPNKINFEFQHEPDKESFGKTLHLLSDVQEFGKALQKPDGTMDREKFAKIMHYGLNFEDYLIRAMTQAKNATIKALLPDNSQGGLVRHLPSGQEPSELDQYMQASLKV